METRRQDPALGTLHQNGIRQASWFSFTPIAATLIGLSLLGSGLVTIGVLAGYSPVDTDVTTAIWLLNFSVKCLYFTLNNLQMAKIRKYMQNYSNTKIHFRLKTLKYRLYRRRF